MKHFKFLTLTLISLSIITLTSCKKDKTDTIDLNQYVGTWQYSGSGTLTLYKNGQVFATSPINETGTVTITKSGTNGLKIEDKIFTVVGDQLSSDPENFTGNINGADIVGTETDQGTLGSNIITIHGSGTGTWSNSSGDSGNFSATITRTLIK